MAQRQLLAGEPRRVGSMKGLFHMVKTASLQLMRDEAPLHAAGLAYSTSLSLAPLLLLIVWAIGSIGPGLQEDLIEELVVIVGPQAGETIRTVAQSANSEPSLTTPAGWAGLVMLLVGATAVFAQLQSALNRVWNVKQRPRKGIFSLVRKRVLSLGMILAIGFLLLVSLALSAGLALLGKSASGALSGMEEVWMVANFLISLLVISALFAAIFRFLPDVRLGWRDVAFGAVLTAVLFTIGKALLGIYLGRGTVGSAYGAAGSLVVMLVWVYYSALVLLFGAELTEVHASRYGGGVHLKEHAEWREPPAAGEQR